MNISNILLGLVILIMALLIYNNQDKSDSNSRSEKSTRRGLFKSQDEIKKTNNEVYVLLVIAGGVIFVLYKIWLYLHLSR